MTDARFPDRWLNDRRILRLSPEHFRAFVLSLTWTVSNRTDGRVEVEDLDMMPACSVDTAAALVDAGLWEPADDGTGWQIVDFLSTQTSRAQLEGLELKKRQDADRAKNYRQRKKGDGMTAERDEPRDRHVTESRDDIGQARQGKDRPGQAEDHTHTHVREDGPAAGGGCSVGGCSDSVTAYTRRTYGREVCGPHGEELVAAGWGGGGLG